MTPAATRRSKEPIDLPEGTEHGTESGYSLECGCRNATSPTGYGCTDARLDANMMRKVRAKHLRLGRTEAEAHAAGLVTLETMRRQAGARMTAKSPSVLCSKTFDRLFPETKPCRECGKPNGMHRRP